MEHIVAGKKHYKNQCWVNGSGTANLDVIFRLDSLVFFFFQAEDGIRFIGVTGVQTCALPI